MDELGDVAAPKFLESAETYELEGFPTTPAVMRRLIPSVVQVGETIRRRDLLVRVLAEHTRRGGITSSANSLGQLKRALYDMSKAGEVERHASTGYWRYLGVGDVNGLDSTEVSDLPGPVDLEDLDPFTVEHTSGEGEGTIYVYYFPAYHRSDQPFPLKIGMSHGPYQVRLAGQLGTSNPERPVIYRIHHTDQPKVLERYLHCALKLQGTWMEDAPGTEWFSARPEAIDDLLRFVGLLPT